MAKTVVIHSGPVVTLQQARECGFKRYFTGKPCPQGHVAERWVGSSCVECQRLRRDPKVNYAAVKAWRKNNKDKVNAQARRRYARTPEKVKAVGRRYRERNIAWLRPKEAREARERRRYDPEGQRARRLKFRAKLEAKRVELAGRPKPEICELCGGNHHPSWHPHIVFDHDHISGKFRGWICDRCNKVLGLVRDDPLLLRKMAVYLARGRDD